MDDDTRTLIKLLGDRFIQRKDVKAWQHADGSWAPDRTPMTTKDFIEHLAGRKTLGHYMMDQSNKCRYFAFDIDIIDQERFDGPHEGCDDPKPHKHPWKVKGVEYDLREEWLKPDSPFREHLTIQLRCMAEGLAIRANRVTEGMPVSIATSGSKGVHVYCFTGSLPGEALRNFALATLSELTCFVPTKGTNFFKHESQYRALEIEIFPKQASLEGKDLGNLMSLPLGINRKSGNRKEFISCKVGLNRLSVMDPVRAMEGDLPWE